jgi:acetoin:2,6-dichlorophenolindophenol oxidoreductase subunit alpha
LPTYERTLREAGPLDDATAQKLKEEAVAAVEDAVTFAKQSPEPDPAQAGRYVFADGGAA